MMEESAFNVDLLPTFQPSYEYAGRISDVPYLVRAFGDQLCIRNNETHMPGWVGVFGFEFLYLSACVESQIEYLTFSTC